MIVCTLLLSSVCTAALAADNHVSILVGQRDIAMVLGADDHQHVIAHYEGQEPYQEVYVSNSAATHSLYKYYRGVCVHCSKEGSSVIIEDAEPHTFRYTGQNQHIVGASRHKYFYQCSVCGETTYDTFLCPGTGNGDCIIITPVTNRVIVTEKQ